MRVLRVQDREGRGPYRPGFSHVWIDDDHTGSCPSIFDDFGPDVVNKMSLADANGCAFRNLDAAAKWFSRKEALALQKLGYSLVAMTVDRVIAESETQMLVSRRKPFRDGCVVIPWATLRAAMPTTG